jgi:large subunit ribosomal protein L19
MDLKSIVKPKKNPNVPDFRSGDTVRVMARVVEGERERVQAFEGVVIRKRRGGINSSFTVRRVTHGVGVERTFLLHSPRLESVKVVRVGRVRRSRLYYLRSRVGKKARIRAGSRDRFEELTRQLAEADEEPPEETEEEAPAGEIEAEEEVQVEGEAGEPVVEEAAEAEPEEEPEAEPQEAVEEPTVEATGEDEPEAKTEPEPEEDKPSAD